MATKVFRVTVETGDLGVIEDVYFSSLETATEFSQIFTKKKYWVGISNSTLLDEIPQFFKDEYGASKKS